MQPTDDEEVWEAGGSGGSDDPVGKQDAGGAQAGETPPRSCICQGNQTVGCRPTLCVFVFVFAFVRLCECTHTTTSVSHLYRCLVLL